MDRGDNNQMRLNGQPLGGPGFGKRGLGPGAAPARADPAPDDAAARLAREYREAQSRQPEIDFTIRGHDLQYVEIELDPGEAVIAENGAMIWKDQDIDMAMVMGDGADDDAGLLGKAGAALRSGLAGEALVMTQFTHIGAGKARVALGGQVAGQIVAVRLEEIGGTLVCRRDSFLAAAKGARLSVRLQRSLVSGMVGGEGLMMQTISGSGWVFLHVGGALIERELAAGDVIHVDTGCHVAHQCGVDMNVRLAGGVRVVSLGGEGLVMTTLRGPGRVWMQTLQPRPCAPVPTLGSTAAHMADGLGDRVGEGLAEAGFEFVRKLF